MATVAEIRKLLEQFLGENKTPTAEIIKKKYYFPIDRLEVIIFLLRINITVYKYDIS